MKVRDIQKSHEFREAVKIWGDPFSRRRIFIAPPMHTAKEKDIDLSILRNMKAVEENDQNTVCIVEKDIDLYRKERDDFKTWIAERKTLRHDINTMGFNSSWYHGKPNKTESEIRVYEQVKKPADNDFKTEDRTSHEKRRISSGHIHMLPLLNNPLPIALAIIADYIQKQRIRLVDLFSNVDKNKDWMVSRDELRNALKYANLPLTDAQLDELILVLDVDSDGLINYQELSKAIEAYYKDRRWQKLKEIYDNEVDASRASDNVDPTSDGNCVVLLQLPALDYREQTPELISRQRSREKRLRKQQERKERQRAKMKFTAVAKEKLVTTLSGPIGERKLRYLEHINIECERCIDLLHSAGLNVKASALKKVLVPPNESSVSSCVNRLGANRSIFPENHPLIVDYNRRQRNKTRNSFRSQSNTNSDNTSSQCRKNAELPRVATIDFKGRNKEARRLRQRRQCTSPTVFWPQHLLDKLSICMDNCGSKDGTSAVFSRVR